MAYAPPRETIAQFAQLAADMLKSDRWVLIGCSGDMGEGKSCFTHQLTEAIARLTGTPYDLKHNMTYTRKELSTWMDGDKDGKGQMPEFSSLLCDELISMFFKRNWFDSDQIDGIELLNKVRDRHQVVAGNIPVLWDLDSAILPLFSFWIHIPERGRAWVFRKSRNPWAKDKWYLKTNEKLWDKNKNPYTCKGFVCEILYPDWEPEQKKYYYEIRNLKRKDTEGQRNKDKFEKYAYIKVQRNDVIRFSIEQSKRVATAIKTFKKLHNGVTLDKSPLEPHLKPIQQKDLADITGLSPSLIGLVMKSER